MTMTIGEKVKSKREKLGYSQKKIAKMVGLTNASVCSIESDAPCNMQSLLKICEVLKLKVELVDADDSNKVVFNSSDLNHDINACCKQLDKVKKTLQELSK